MGKITWEEVRAEQDRLDYEASEVGQLRAEVERLRAFHAGVTNAWQQFYVWGEWDWPEYVEAMKELLPPEH